MVTVNASNAINLVCRGMTDYPEHVAIQERSCAALAAFSKNDRAGQETVPLFFEGCLWLQPPDPPFILSLL